MARHALIIGNTAYDDPQFAPLPGATADAHALATVLADPAIGGFTVETLVDAPLRPATRALEAFFTRAARDDLLLLHLSLHGWKDRGGRLHFAMTDTERDFPGATAVTAHALSGWMGDSRSRRIVVLLDCCYSGAFTLNALHRQRGTGAVDVTEPFAGLGRIVMTASTSLQYAHEAEHDVRYSRTPAKPSVFTSAVVAGLGDGSADLDGDGLVSVDELYDYVHERVRRTIADQTPTLSMDSAQGTVYLARSPRHGDVDRLTEMRTAALDPQAWKRVGSLHLVEQLLGSVREPSRDTARACLLGLIADADREVARRARQLWHERGLGEIPAVRPPRPARPPVPHGPGSAPGPVAGIDFGTTNSAIALFEGEDVRLVPNAEGALTTPSVVAVTADGQIVVGAPAARQAVTNPDHTVRSVKLRLGTAWSITRGAVRLTAEDVAELILRRLREDAEACAGRPLHGAVLTVPADFDLDQRAALVEAAGRAGIRALRVINEPTAAAITYGLHRMQGTTVLVFDLGGGTLDVSLIEIGDGVVEVKATGGDCRLGGDDWDRRVVDWLLHRVRERHALDLSADVTVMQRLREAAEAAKIELSSASSTTVRLPYLTFMLHGPVHLEETLTRKGFEDMTQDLLLRCRRPVEQAMRDAVIPWSELERVILTGGATRMPAIGDLMSSLTGGRQPYRGLIPEGIVTGAALQGGILSGAVQDTLLLDVTSSSLGYEAAGGAVAQVIARNTTIPTRRREWVATSAQKRQTLILHVVEGESTTAAECRSLAVLELTDLAAHPSGTPLVDVLFDFDANGLLTVSARELRGRTKELPIRVAELNRVRRQAGMPNATPRQERLPAELEAKYFTGRTWKVTVDRASVARANSLVRSARWQTLKELTPRPWDPPES
ncbi:caspase, EACC1-associated type [Streptomyces humidus]|uniref:caspase, EACC1-associated type n=1 Tax=Streptomyces humidus TaxID=52259 RepID=UPI003330F3D1